MYVCFLFHVSLFLSLLILLSQKALGTCLKSESVNKRPFDVFSLLCEINILTNSPSKEGVCGSVLSELHFRAMGHMNAPFPFIQPLMAVNMSHVLYESQSDCVIVSVEASISYHSVCFKRSFQNAEVSCDLGVELDVELKAGGVVRWWVWSGRS